MALDFNKIAPSIHCMVCNLAENSRDFAAAIDIALEKLATSPNLTELNNKISHSKTSWLVGEPAEELNSSFEVPTTPDEFSVLATDGSQVDVDRHRSVRCYLLNIGSVLLKYGQKPHAILDSMPILYSSNDELILKSPESTPGK